MPLRLWILSTNASPRACCRRCDFARPHRCRHQRARWNRYASPKTLGNTRLGHWGRAGRQNRLRQGLRRPKSWDERARRRQYGVRTCIDLQITLRNGGCGRGWRWLGAVEHTDCERDSRLHLERSMGRLARYHCRHVRTPKWPTGPCR